jgi:hypothetical protein
MLLPLPRICLGVLRTFDPSKSFLQQIVSGRPSSLCLIKMLPRPRCTHRKPPSLSEASELTFSQSHKSNESQRPPPPCMNPLQAVNVISDSRPAVVAVKRMTASRRLAAVPTYPFPLNETDTIPRFHPLGIIERSGLWAFSASAVVLLSLIRTTPHNS